MPRRVSQFLLRSWWDLGITTATVAHRRIAGFWRASVVGGLSGMMLWIAGALVSVGFTEGIAPMDADAILPLLKAMGIVSGITIPAAILSGYVIRQRSTRAPKESHPEVRPVVR